MKTIRINERTPNPEAVAPAIEPGRFEATVEIGGRTLVVRGQIASAAVQSRDERLRALMTRPIE